MTCQLMGSSPAASGPPASPFDRWPEGHPPPHRPARLIPLSPISAAIALRAGMTSPWAGCTQTWSAPASRCAWMAAAIGLESPSTVPSPVLCPLPGFAAVRDGGGWAVLVDEPGQQLDEGWGEDPWQVGQVLGQDRRASDLVLVGPVRRLGRPTRRRLRCPQVALRPHTLHRSS